MHQRRHALLAFGLTLAVLGGCAKAPPKDGTEAPLPEPPHEEPATPAGYTKIPPAPLDSPRQMLAQTGTILRGTLKDVQWVYTPCGGPRTAYVFGDSSGLAGVAIGPNVTLKVLGGPTPAGTWVRVAELPQLALDAQYVIFLRNTDWTYSPIVSNLVFREETVGGRQVLVDPGGHVVTGWSEEGPTYSNAIVSGRVGDDHRRVFLNPQPLPPGLPTSDSPATGAVSGDHARPSDPAVDPSASSPTAAEIRASGMFARPALDAAAAGDVQGVDTQSFVSAVSRAAGAAQVQIGGRLALEPYWKCWDSTPTAKR
jgi:hypothetical protein